MSERTDVLPPSRMRGLTGPQVAGLVTEIKGVRDLVFKEAVSAMADGKRRDGQAFFLVHGAVDRILGRVLELSSEEAPRG